MKVNVHWDDREAVAIVTHENVFLERAADVMEWKESVLSRLQKLYERVGHPFPMAVCFDGFVVRPDVSALYGDVVKNEIRKFVSMTARYGEASVVRALVATEAIRQGYRANLFGSLDEALQYIRQHRPKGSPRPRLR